MRVVFEYNPLTAMKLEWNTKMKKIVFTTMIPPHGIPRDERQHFFPGDSYDAFAWDGECWMFEENVPLPIDKRLEGRQF
ncbi:hypothetical protein FACS189467_0330 [Bacteroidia bacterium]|nr:hypothetical protein FACS189467_0330 [Bacteroidia bacterium]